jgi:elongation factor G
MTPVMCGSAFKNKGVQLLLDACARTCPNPTEVENEGLRPVARAKRRSCSSRPQQALVGLAFKLQQDKYGQLTYIRIYQGKIEGRHHRQLLARARRSKVPRMFRMHSDEMRGDRGQGGDIVALYGIECSSGDTFTDGSQLHADVDARARRRHLARGDSRRQGHRDELLEGAQPLHEGRPDLPRAPRRRVGQTIISGMGELHLDIYMERMRASTAARSSSVSRRWRTARRSPSEASSRTPTRSRPVARVSSRRSAAYMRAAPRGRENCSTSSSTTSSAARSRASTSPRVTTASARRLDRGVLIGFPVVGVRCEINDGGVPRGRLQRHAQGWTRSSLSRS